MFDQQQEAIMRLMTFIASLFFVESTISVSNQAYDSKANKRKTFSAHVTLNSLTNKGPYPCTTM
jgi:hypothetical protein